MCSFQPTSSFKQVTGFHKDGLGSNHSIFQPSSLRTPKISIKEFGDFLSDKARKKNRKVVHTNVLTHAKYCCFILQFRAFVLILQ
jgi:hypothetical protein